MYFMPKTNRWYSWAVHTKAVYRYSMSCVFLVILMLGWRYGIYAWFDAAINSERASISQLQQQLIQLARAERLSKELADNTLPMLRRQLQEFFPSSASAWQQQQFDCVMVQAQKAGVQIVSYTDEKEKKKPWGSYRGAQLSMSGTYEQIGHFLMSLKQSSYMIQCNQFRSNRTEGDQFAASCNLKFMMAGR
ncbi:hypothetical protein E3J61_02870 [Candidatus Dependentiae bacterium]|nr:MAG: hypothetical protein E3J61_02870 [Candidatus Dependentiae bacterium]